MKLRDLFLSAPERHFVVYAARPGAYVAVTLDPATPDASVQATIAAHENSGTSPREYAGLVQPGSFNLVRLDAKDKDAAVSKAKARGLVHEPIRVVLGRYSEQLRVETDRKRQDMEDGARAFGELMGLFRP